MAGLGELSAAPVRNQRPPFLGKSPASAGPGAGVPLVSPPCPASRPGRKGGARGEFTSGGARSHLRGPSLGQAEHPVCTWAVACPTLAPVATRGVDTVLGTAAPSNTALVHVCGKGGVRQEAAPTLRPLETDLLEGHPGRTGGPRPLREGGPRLTRLAEVPLPPCGALAAAWLDTAPSILAWWLADCCG